MTADADAAMLETLADVMCAPIESDLRVVKCVCGAVTLAFGPQVTIRGFRCPNCPPRLTVVEGGEA